MVHFVVLRRFANNTDITLTLSLTLFWTTVRTEMNFVTHTYIQLIYLYTHTNVLTNENFEQSTLWCTKEARGCAFEHGVPQPLVLIFVLIVYQMKKRYKTIKSSNIVKKMAHELEQKWSKNCSQLKEKIMNHQVIIAPKN